MNYFLDKNVERSNMPANVENRRIACRRHNHSQQFDGWLNEGDGNRPIHKQRGNHGRVDHIEKPTTNHQQHD